MEKQLSPEIQMWVGGLDPIIFTHEGLVNYVKSGVVYGYLGHSSREDWVDAMMCEAYLPTINVEYLAVWLTSTDARHFADLIQDKLDEGGKDAVKEYIDEFLPRVNNLGMIYGSPEHDGTFDSSLELYTKFEEKGLLM